MNNYDQSSTGISVEFTGCYDAWLSRMYFEENFNILRYSSIRESSLSVFTDYGNYNPEPEFTSDRPIRDIIWQVYNLIYDSYSFDNYRDFIEQLHDYADKLKDLTIDDIVDYLTDDDDYNIFDDIETFENCYLKPNFEIIGIRGYSQGDYAEVILFDEVKKQFREGFDFVKLFGNYFYDTPVSGTLTVNDKEFNVDEYLNDYYEWDKDEFLEMLYKDNELTDAEKEQIENVVPVDLRYLD